MSREKITKKVAPTSIFPVDNLLELRNYGLALGGHTAWFEERQSAMEKKINALKSAYAAKDGAMLRKAAAAVVAHDRKHPFASLCGGLEACQTVLLAKRIIEAPALPF